MLLFVSMLKFRQANAFLIVIKHFKTLLPSNF